MKLDNTEGVRTGEHVFAICVNTGIIIKIRNILGIEHLRRQFNHLFDNISEGDIKDFVFIHNAVVVLCYRSVTPNRWQRRIV